MMMSVVRCLHQPLYSGVFSNNCITVWRGHHTRKTNTR